PADASVLAPRRSHHRGRTTRGGRPPRGGVGAGGARRDARRRPLMRRGPMTIRTFARHATRAMLAMLAMLPAAAPAAAQQNFDTVRVTVQPVAGRVHVLFGSGGNMALLAGDDGAILVDDQYAPLS